MNRDVLGRCPECRGRIRRSDLLIRYEREDGTAMYAECPECERVVHPAARSGNDRSTGSS